MYLKGFAGNRDRHGRSCSMDLIKKIFGTPTKHEEEKKEHEVVETPEFDITQYAKKLGVTIGILVPAVTGGLEAFQKIEMPTAVIVGALGVTAAALLGIAFVSAVDIAARAFLSGEGSGQKKESSEDETAGAAEVFPAPKGMKVWLEKDGGPHPVLAMSSSGDGVGSYLIATGSTHDRTVDGRQVKAIDGAAKWYGEDEVQAIRADRWP
jgi:hypothetical protein